MKRFLINLFGLKELKDVIYRAMQEQKKEDDKEHQKKLNRIDELYNQQLALQRQSHEAKVRMLENKICTWEAKEKSLLDREHKADMQIKINLEIATGIVEEAKAISENVGKFQMLYDKAEIIHKNRFKEIK